MGIYEVNNELLQELKNAKEQNADIITADTTVEKAKDLLQDLGKIVVNYQIDYDAYDKVEKEANQSKKTIKKSIDYYTREIEKLLHFLYGNNVEEARKQTKGFLSLRKSEQVYIPDEVKKELLKDEITLEMTDNSTGEIKDVTNDYLKRKVVLDINKTDIKKELEGNDIEAVFKNGNRVPIELQKKINIKVKFAQIERRG